MNFAIVDTPEYPSVKANESSGVFKQFYPKAKVWQSSSEATFLMKHIFFAGVLHSIGISCIWSFLLLVPKKVWFDRRRVLDALRNRYTSNKYHLSKERDSGQRAKNIYFGAPPSSLIAMPFLISVKSIIFVVPLSFHHYYYDYYFWSVCCKSSKNRAHKIVGWNHLLCQNIYVFKIISN